MLYGYAVRAKGIAPLPTKGSRKISSFDTEEGELRPELAHLLCLLSEPSMRKASEVRRSCLMSACPWKIRPTARLSFWMRFATRGRQCGVEWAEYCIRPAAIT
jgi:hypothetical protein